MKQIEGIRPVLQNSLGQKNNCTVCSMAVVLSSYMARTRRNVRFAPVYAVVVKYAKRRGFNFLGRGTNPFMICGILRRSARYVRIGLRSKAAFIKGVGYSFTTIRRLIDADMPVILSVWRAGKYKRHTVTVVGYDARNLLIYDNWSLGLTALPYRQVSVISSINWLE